MQHFIGSGVLLGAVHRINCKQPTFLVISPEFCV
jgi:hypothetical protein